MKIKIDPHTLIRAEERGTDPNEIIEIIKNGNPTPAKYNCQGKTKVFEYRKERKGKYYEQKKVKVIYVIEDDLLTTVTVYVFYGKWL